MPSTAFKECGVSRMAISLDGPDAQSHDDFRGIPGTFDRAMLALYHAKKIGLETQYQTTVTRRNLARLPEMAKIAEDVGTKMWSLFFLIVTGRALENMDLTADEYEQVFDFMYELSKTAPFAIKTTEAMHYRRYVAQRMKAEHRSMPESEKAGAVMWRTAGVSDGKGFVFVSHTGEIFPSGFLPITAGNVLRDSLTDVYRNSSLFRSLRDVSQREGKCGIMRISEGVRRLALPRLCAHRQLSGGRPALHVSAAPGRSHRLAGGAGVYACAGSPEPAANRAREWYKTFSSKWTNCTPTFPDSLDYSSRFGRSTIFSVPPQVFWPYCAAIVSLAVAIAAFWRPAARAPGFDKLRALAPAAYAIPLVIFGADHLSSIKEIMTCRALMDARQDVLDHLRRRGPHLGGIQHPPRHPTPAFHHLVGNHVLPL